MAKTLVKEKVFQQSFCDMWKVYDLDTSASPRSQFNDYLTDEGIDRTSSRYPATFSKVSAHLTQG